MLGPAERKPETRCACRRAAGTKAAGYETVASLRQNYLFLQIIAHAPGLNSPSRGSASDLSSDQRPLGTTLLTERRRARADGKARGLHEFLERLGACARTRPKIFAAATRTQLQYPREFVEIDDTRWVVHESE